MTPIIIDAETLQSRIVEANTLIVDLQSPEHYVNAHIPGAVNLDYNTLVVNNGQAGGLLPNADSFTAVAQSLGISPESHVIAYDAEGGAAASRLIWTLHVYGHINASLLDGGLRHWAAKRFPLEQGHNTAAVPGKFIAQTANDAVIHGDELLARLGSSGLKILDARSADEFSGVKVLAARGGHIPGAAHLEWTDALDPVENLVLKPDAVLQQMLDEREIHKDDEVVVHCQTHRRSSLTYVVLKHLGYENVRGYHGSWSEWGNRNDTPVDTVTS